MNNKSLEMPKFRGESDEADWWASWAGRDYVKRKSAEAQAAGIKVGGSPLVAKLNQEPSVRIALHPPHEANARVRKHPDKSRPV